MKKILLFIGFILVSISQTKASHVFGAEMTYQCLGNDQYLVTYVFYRDCFGIPMPTSIQVDINNICGFPQNQVTLDLDTGSIIQIAPICPGQLTTCEGGTQVGVQRMEYTGIITLPAPCASWTFGISQSSRSASISMSVNPDNYDLYVEASLNNENSLCNTSPIFENRPPILTCIGQPFCLDPGVFESEGDSFVVSLIGPMVDPNTTLPYDSGYGIQTPFSSSVPFEFDQHTGILCFTPNRLEIGVIAVKVTEYRNGTVIGAVERDIMQYTVNCNNDAPQLSGINGSNNYSIDACAGEQLCFTIASSDLNANDNTLIYSHSGIPAASFTTTGGTRDSANFCWIPSVNDIDTNAFELTVNVIDDNCSVPIARSFHYYITVHDTATCAILSAGNISYKDDINIYPVPAGDVINVELTDKFLKRHPSYHLENIQCRIIAKGNLNSGKNTVDLSRFSNGIYFISLLNDSGDLIMKQKVVISR